MSEKKIKIVHIIMLILGTVFLASGAFHSGLWFDESYTVGLMNQNLVDLCKAATYDVHPLLYYILLRIYAYIFGNSIISLRLFSVLGAALLAWLGYTHVRRDFGVKTGIWFSFFVITMPSTFKYALQIRMYTWSPLFVTLAAIYVYRMIIQDDKYANTTQDMQNPPNTHNTKNTVFFAMFSVMAAYMHYYGLMAVVIINIMLFVYYIKNNMKLRKWFIIALIQIVAYLPGIYVFLIQFMQSNGSWISIQLNTFFDTISFHFLGIPQGDLDGASSILAIALCIGFCMYSMLGFLLVRMRKNNKEESKPVVLALTVYFGVILAFLAISIFKPLYYVRYSIVSYGLLIFAFAYMLAKCNKISLKILIVVVMLGLSVARAIPIYLENYDSSNNMIDDYLKENMQDGDIILFDSAGARAFSISVKYQDVPTYYYNNWEWNVEKAFKAFGSKVTILSSLDGLKNYCGRIWIIGNDASYKEVMSWYGTTELSYEKMKLNYYYNKKEFEIILIDKKI